MSYHHLTEIERGKIELLLDNGFSRSAIARQLGRSRATIYRELNRLASRDGTYSAHEAQRDYREKRRDCIRHRVLDRMQLQTYVRDKLSELWSPEQTANRLWLDYPHDPWMRVSTETIYRTLYTDAKWNSAFVAFLRQGRKTRQKRCLGSKRRGPIANRVSIEKRPAEVDALATYGHWEGDTVIGKNQNGAIVTLVERKGDWLRAVPVASRKADEVARAVVQALQDMPPHLRKTITFDNGSEFAGHDTIAQQLNVDIFFAHPYSAYERGRNENANGLLRQYIPKGMSFENVTQEQLRGIVNQLNDRPRKKQEYRTPNEVFKEQRICLACS
jgi:transposase, IS30 family